MPPRSAICPSWDAYFKYRDSHPPYAIARLPPPSNRPLFKFNESVSFVERCDSQKEVDSYWSKLTAEGGSESQCGLLKDKFGLSWQIVPARLPDLLKHPKAVHAMLQMKKLDIAELERAAHT